MKALALALNQTRERSSVGSRLLQYRRGVFRTPRDFIGFDGRTEAFQFRKRQFLALRSQLRVVTKPVLIPLPSNKTGSIGLGCSPAEVRARFSTSRRRFSSVRSWFN